MSYRKGLKKEFDPVAAQLGFTLHAEYTKRHGTPIYKSADGQDMIEISKGRMISPGLTMHLDTRRRRKNNATSLGRLAPWLSDIGYIYFPNDPDSERAAKVLAEVLVKEGMEWFRSKG